MVWQLLAMFIYMNHIDLPAKAVIRDPKHRAGWIIYQLKLRGESLASVARKYGKRRQLPTMALRVPYPLWEKRIADMLELTPQELFPERYDRNGLPNRPMGRPKKSSVMTPKNSTPKKGRNVKDRKVA
ncbi:MAG: helix-turn-helix domain-containing protein [Chromatiales bacterium]